MGSMGPVGPEGKRGLPGSPGSFGAKVIKPYNNTIRLTQNIIQFLT